MMIPDLMYIALGMGLGKKLMTIVKVVFKKILYYMSLI